MTVTPRAIGLLLLATGCTEPDADGSALLIFVVIGVVWLAHDLWRLWKCFR